MHSPCPLVVEAVGSESAAIWCALGVLGLWDPLTSGVVIPRHDTPWPKTVHLSAGPLKRSMTVRVAGVGFVMNHYRDVWWFQPREMKRKLADGRESRVEEVNFQVDFDDECMKMIRGCGCIQEGWAVKGLRWVKD